MTAADVYARLRRLEALSVGFKAELDAIAKELWPFYPTQAILYSKAIQDAQEAIEHTMPCGR
jgi:hypothetical protein